MPLKTSILDVKIKHSNHETGRVKSSSEIIIGFDHFIVRPWYISFRCTLKDLSYGKPRTN